MPPMTNQEHKNYRTDWRPKRAAMFMSPLKKVWRSRVFGPKNALPIRNHANSPERGSGN